MEQIAFNDFHTPTMNFQSFSQVAFAFRVTPKLLTEGMLWAAAIGLVGGLLPAIRAARLPHRGGIAGVVKHIVFEKSNRSEIAVCKVGTARRAVRGRLSEASLP